MAGQTGRNTLRATARRALKEERVFLKVRDVLQNADRNVKYVERGRVCFLRRSVLHTRTYMCVLYRQKRASFVRFFSLFTSYVVHAVRLEDDSNSFRPAVVKFAFKSVHSDGHFSQQRDAGLDTGGR